MIYTTKEDTSSFNILASIATTLDALLLSGFATFLWLQLHVRILPIKLLLNLYKINLMNYIYFNISIFPAEEHIPCSYQKGI